MSCLDRKLIRDLLHLRGQVLAVALVVACGVASFISMRNTYQSLLGTQRAYYADYRFAEVFAQARRAPEWLAGRIGEIPGVGAVQTRIVADVTLDVPGLDEPATGRLISIPERRAQMLNDLHLVSGRYIEAGRRDEVLISAAFAAKNNFHPGDTLSAIINGRWTKLRIVGTALSPEYVYEIRAGDMFPDSRRFGVIWISREALGAAFNLEGAFNDVALSLAPGASEAEVIARLDALLDDWGGTGAYGRDEQTSNHFISNEIAELKVSGTFIPAVFLAVTAFLIHLVLSRLVSTQREQVAVLKAFGYDNRAIGLHYLKLALVVVSGGTILGGLVGWWFGYRMTALYAEFFRFPVLRYELNPWVTGSAVLISFAAASVGALRAVGKAVALPPAEAMRPEPPARFQTGMIERLGFQRLLPLSVRIIVRNLERNPVKAVLSAFGIALSVSLVIVGFYFFDAIDQIITVQFRFKFHHDISVVFNEPRSARARQDLASLPGVMRVEAYRTLPVRLRSGHYSKRTAIFGLEPAGEMHRLVDRNLRTFTLPADGLVLSTELAEKLRVKAGDVLTVEVMEGARPVRQVPVTALVDELMGLTAYMNVQALNHLMNEGGTVTSAYLMVDANAMPELYALLKRTPAVSGVWIPSVWLENFNATIARTIWTSTAIIIAFACIIVFGMVYNGARIALSERGRELASLRVLGFTQAEIGVMLLGEQAILTGLAIPLGYGLGFLICLAITKAIDTELMRLPLVFSARTWALGFIVTAVAAFLSGLLVQWRLRRLDLVEVLKTRE